MTTHLTVSDRIGEAIRDARKRHGWTQDDLAGRCAALGAPHLTGPVIYDIESGRRDKATGERRRDVSADDVIALAVALDVAPMHLIFPIDDDDGSELVALTETISVRADHARWWFRGRYPLKGTDRRMYYAYVPEADLARAEELAQLQDVRPELFEPGGPLHIVTESEASDEH
jgi:transcriptional regulator with XRE-family HTH domain